MGRLSRRILGLSEDEVRFDRRGFRGGDAAMRAHIEKIGWSFLAGYHAALEEPRAERLAPRLEATEADYRGFTYEGAAMSLTLLDVLLPGRPRRLRAYLAGAGGAHVYMVHVGAGWAMARLPFGMGRLFRRLDPLLRWLALDGYGFHQGYFHWPKAVAGRQEVPRRVRGYARRAFDQGLGRSLWFVDGAGVRRIPRTIASFPASRQADLWSGVGLACTYAGGVDSASIATLREAGSAFAAELAQGAAFAAKTRQRADNLAPHVEIACEMLCGCSASEAAELTDLTLLDLPPDGERPAYEVWRARVRDRLAEAAA